GLGKRHPGAGGVRDTGRIAEARRRRRRRQRAAPHVLVGWGRGAPRLKTRALIRPTDLLRCEHATILTTLEKLETLAADTSRGTQLRDERAWGVTSFLVSYLQNFHLEKEDHLLFPALRDAGMPADDGPLQG